MPAKTFTEFEQLAHEQGYPDTAEKSWEPNLVLDTHTHPFDVMVQVVQGNYRLTIGNEVRELKAGDEFRLARDIPHAEHYGPAGATIWVGRAS